MSDEGVADAEVLWEISVGGELGEDLQDRDVDGAEVWGEHAGLRRGQMSAGQQGDRPVDRGGGAQVEPDLGEAPADRPDEHRQPLRGPLRRLAFEEHPADRQL
ncbi:hypothetical protein AB0C52_24605 [Streptomyces sp. NPDC048717]|uniref:hypothetical protein n=1 Tax=Streptomyces sp. NPDC048717 TaxID=3154928 RepID=UPI00343C65DD